MALSDKYSRRTIALFWLIVVAIAIALILIYEQIALLYVLATIAITVLMLIVAFADLENVGRDKAEDFANRD